jgi:hypothetical protein
MEINPAPRATRGIGALQGLHAATGPAVYTVYEANVTDEAAYTKALPEVDKIIKENTGIRVAGGFNKSKLIDGKTPVGNRYVIIKWDSEADFTKAEKGGIRTWLEKNLRCDARHRPRLASYRNSGSACRFVLQRGPEAIPNL